MAQDVSSSGMDESSAENTLHAIAIRLRSLDASIRHLVSLHQEELLAQAGQAAALKSSVQGIDARTERLVKAAARLKREVITPFEELKGHVRLLERLQAAGDLLRRVLRVTSLIRKLKAQLTRPGSTDTLSAIGTFDSREHGKAAQTLYDIEAYTMDPSQTQLHSVVLVQSELSWVADAGKLIRARASTLLHKGMDTLNQAELGAALQMFFDLRCLPERVEEALSRVIESVQSTAAAAFDVSTLAKTVGNPVASPGTAAASTSVRKPGNAKGTGGHPPLGSEATWKAGVWTRVDSLLERLFRASIQVWNLQRVLCKKRDPLSYARLVDVVLASPAYAVHTIADTTESSEGGGGEEGDPQGASVGSVWPPRSHSSPSDGSNALFERYWGIVTAKLRTQLSLAVTSSSFLRDCLVEGFPKLRGLLISSCNRLQRNTDARATDVLSVGGTAAEQDRLLWVVSGLLDVFLARSLSRVNEPLNVMFPRATGGLGAVGGVIRSKALSLIGGSGSGGASTGKSTDVDGKGEEESYPEPPSHAVVSLLVKAIQNEFHGCQSDARLCREICRGVVAALKTFVARVEGSVVVNSFATAIPDHFQRTGAQRHNHALLSRLTQVERALEEFCAGQEPLVQGIVTEAIRPAISSINTQIGSILSPYLAALIDKLETYLASMHDQSYVKVSTAHELGSSYIVSLSEALASVSKLQLSGLPDGAVAEYARSAMIQRLVSVFTRLASCIRPIDDSGKLRLSQDINHLDFALQQHLPRGLHMDAAVAALGELRSLKELMFIPTSSLTVDSDVVTALKPSVVMHVLIARSPPELELPHARSSMSLAEYCEWVDGMVIASETGTGSGGGVLERRSLLCAPLSSFLHAEQAVWVRVRSCLDKFAQRVSASKSSTAALSSPEACEEYVWLLNNCPKLVAAFRDAVAKE